MATQPLITPVARPPEPRRDIAGAVTVGALAGAGAFWLTGAAGLELLDKPVAWHFGYFLKFVAWKFFGFFQDAGSNYFLFMQNQPSLELVWFVAGVSGVGVGMWVAVLLSAPRDPVIHKAGRRLSNSKTVAQRQNRVDGPAVVTVGGIPFSLERLRRSIFMFGSPGGGKTQLIWQFLPQLQAAGFKILIIDGPKGDFSQHVPGAFIISPWHAGPAWHIGKDIGGSRNRLRTLAGRIIPSNDKDPVWSNAAQMALVACGCALISRAGTDWGWGDLYDLLSQPITVLKEISAEFYPPARRALEDAESKTTQSIVINLDAFLADVFEMAQAWRNATEKLSFVDWWLDDNHPQKTIIMQGSGEFEGLARGYISGVLGLLISQTSSPSFPESSTRKNMVMIDEAAQLAQGGGLEGLEKIAEIGRSKGCSFLCATQSPQQLIKNWGEVQLNNLTALVGSKFYLRVLGDADQTWVASQFGTREVWLPNESVSSTGGGYTTTNSYTKSEEPALWQKSKFAELGPLGKLKTDKILALYDEGMDACVFKFSKTILKKPLRDVFIPNHDFDKIVSFGHPQTQIAGGAPARGDGELECLAEEASLDIYVTPETCATAQPMQIIEQIKDDVLAIPKPDDLESIGNSESEEVEGELAQEGMAQLTGLPVSEIGLVLDILDSQTPLEALPVLVLPVGKQKKRVGSLAKFAKKRDQENVR